MWNEMNWFGGEQRQKKKICARALTSMHIFQLDFYLTNQPRACCCCFFSSCSIRVVTLAYTTGLNFASKHSSAWCLCLICRVSEAKKRTPSALCMHTASVKIVGALLRALPSHNCSCPCVCWRNSRNWLLEIFINWCVRIGVNQFGVCHIECGTHNRPKQQKTKKNFNGTCVDDD